MRRIGLIAFIGYVASIWLANWLIVHVGPVSVGFGLVAPAGVFMAGIALTLRDILQRAWGRPAVIVAILLGASVSFLIAPSFAFASAAAFLASEFADFAVYTPLERKSWLGAVALSNTVGLLIDSWLFLTLAFGSLEFFWGQVVGKAWVTAAALLVLAGGRRALLARKSYAGVA